MLNVDNFKWELELDEFGVEGIFYFVFFDVKGNEEGNIVGCLLLKFFCENVMVLVKGEIVVFYFSVVGSFLLVDSR